jgi:hypothetical protein
VAAPTSLAVYFGLVDAYDHDGRSLLVKNPLSLVKSLVESGTLEAKAYPLRSIVVPSYSQEDPFQTCSELSAVTIQTSPVVLPVAGKFETVLFVPL